MSLQLALYTTPNLYSRQREIDLLQRRLTLQIRSCEGQSALRD